MCCDAWGGYRTAPPTGPPTLGYTRHVYDPNAGLVYGKARWYAPELGTWMSEDPVGAEGLLETPNALNAWAYANENPLRYTDPTGKLGEAAACVIPFLCPVALSAEAIDDAIMGVLALLAGAGTLAVIEQQRQAHQVGPTVTTTPAQRPDPLVTTLPIQTLPPATTQLPVVRPTTTATPIPEPRKPEILATPIQPKLPKVVNATAAQNITDTLRPNGQLIGEEGSSNGFDNSKEG